MGKMEEFDALLKPWLWQSTFELVNAVSARRAYWEPQTPDKQLGNYSIDGMKDLCYTYGTLK